MGVLSGLFKLIFRVLTAEGRKNSPKSSVKKGVDRVS